MDDLPPRVESFEPDIPVTQLTPLGSAPLDHSLRRRLFEVVRAEDSVAAYNEYVE